MPQLADTDDDLKYSVWEQRCKLEMTLKALESVAKRGGSAHNLPENHYFYITFVTKECKKGIPDWLHTKYPNDLTIVLQYQFRNLEVNRKRKNISVSVVFNGNEENLVIPWKALTRFDDPGAKITFLLGNSDTNQHSEHENLSLKDADSKSPVSSNVIKLADFRPSRVNSPS
ncbi:ClpXP protease specificity-enhancing factor SspB [Acetobacter pasteurianus]|uniref:Uncharacterized protein n=1 Tax=Acetobacter pasteurianus NBRC 3188 TaxID=1226663 RepID=A0A401WXB4_ACEPA|nr:ClpXP protease specificity-enhancing factor SspB [Acetobacter pasteurianus]QHM90071.1 ClpXP protease specificity-enhancing factor SspB [Acetobacter pasteurianus]GCD53956.1 hypothetical protein NBRC3188_2653 [Acetobacter pasteurianus NBRC 3188]